jgi:hypothetical protein
MVKRSFSDAFDQVVGLAAPQTKGHKRTHSSAFEEEDDMESLAKRFHNCKVVEEPRETNLTAFYTEVLGNLVRTPDLQAKGLNQILDSAANGREWRHLFGPELVILLEEVVRWRLCVKHGFSVQEHQRQALHNSFNTVKLFLFEKEL